MKFRLTRHLDRSSIYTLSLLVHEDRFHGCRRVTVRATRAKASFITRTIVARKVTPRVRHRIATASGALTVASQATTAPEGCVSTETSGQ